MSVRTVVQYRRQTELTLIVMAAAIVGVAYTLASLGANSVIPARMGPFLGLVLILIAVAHIAVRKLARGADGTLLPLAFLLHGLGFVMITRLDEDLAGFQALWSLIAVGAFCATLLFVQRAIDLARYKWTLFFIGAGMLLLPMLPGLGYAAGGARIWVSVGPINFQPGEFAKLALAIFFAAYLADRRELIAASTWKVGPLRLPEPQHILPLVVAWGFAVLVMVGQRDLGSSLLFFTLFVVMLWVATERNIYLILGIVLFSGAAYVAWRLFDHVQTRVSIWLDPWEDEYGSGFQIVQALYGIGDGGITGTGLGRGSPDKVPLAQNDFIFAAITEEMGLIGATSILMAYLLLIGAGFRIAIRTDRTFEKLLATGLTTIVGIQAFIIIGGVIKLVPLTGITLPFVSYGGSSLLANYILLALLIRLSDAGAIRRGERTDDPTPRERWAAWKLRRAERKLAS
ncbi:cell division protein FtsW (lipid II flippase) [Ilumatobacter fluminis]|uniref:Cell division protein FtsW (Lipid II flippase) n=1 Tax=Ilumatobacter fluminis TaxID=467091 RepID=A0A4R7I522_9ACTN|nr:FtsW/RodA/SpoVE family cell cycle protein [Ilumatobacter fluminis]TDT18344.1 cell division protein FtsW (lipid II flippase) [Ilumatobacter fluminis]